jgi:hypothetical protein
MDNNSVTLWQLISDWLDQTKLGWKTEVRGETHLIEKIGDPEWHYYIGDDYISTYPSCAFGGNKLIAADPEFFAKLEEFLIHVNGCDKCILAKEMDKIMIDGFASRYAEAADRMRDIKYRFTQLANAYAPFPMHYSTISINIDP